MRLVLSLTVPLRSVVSGVADEIGRTDHSVRTGEQGFQASSAVFQSSVVMIEAAVATLHHSAERFDMGEAAPDTSTKRPARSVRRGQSRLGHSSQLSRRVSESWSQESLQGLALGLFFAKDGGVLRDAPLGFCLDLTQPLGFLLARRELDCLAGQSDLQLGDLPGIVRPAQGLDPSFKLLLALAQTGQIRIPLGQCPLQIAGCAALDPRPGAGCARRGRRIPA